MPQLGAFLSGCSPSDAFISSGLLIPSFLILQAIILAVVPGICDPLAVTQAHSLNSSIPASCPVSVRLSMNCLDAAGLAVQDYCAIVVPLRSPSDPERQKGFDYDLSQH